MIEIVPTTDMEILLLYKELQGVQVEGATIN